MSAFTPPADPLLYVGVDVGIKRDTTAIASIYSCATDDGAKLFVMWACAIFTPPVNMVTQVQPYLAKLFAQQRVVGLGFDYHQMATTYQWLIEQGCGHLCREINQNTEMVLAANTLHAHCWDGTFVMPPDGTVRAHFIACAAEHKERGWRIVKQKQSKPIDATVATAMALVLATQETGHVYHPSARHNRNLSATMLP